jgi:aspartyl-tRNA synthetase
MMLVSQETIREVIAFPKTQSATDLMTGAPAEVDPEALEQVHIQIRPQRPPQIARKPREGLP